jgi:predicted transcriptional regulator
MVVSDKNIRIYVTIARETHDWLKEEALKEDRNVSNLVNVIIKKHIENKKNLP